MWELDHIRSELKIKIGHMLNYAFNKKNHNFSPIFMSLGQNAQLIGGHYDQVS